MRVLGWWQWGVVPSPLALPLPLRRRGIWVREGNSITVQEREEAFSPSARHSGPADTIAHLVWLHLPASLEC